MCVQKLASKLERQKYSKSENYLFLVGARIESLNHLLSIIKNKRIKFAISWQESVTLLCSMLSLLHLLNALQISCKKTSN